MCSSDLTEDQVIGKTLTELTEGARPRFVARVTRALSGEIVTRREDRLYDADGVERVFRWEARPWRDVAGEIGHTTIETSGRRCKCGNYGCLEAYASGPAIAERAREALMGGAPSTLRDAVGGNLAALTAQHVYEVAAQGDEIAREVVRDTARFLGAGVEIGRAHV